MAKRGKRTILTRDLINQICALLSEGHYVVTVCSYVGIGESTYYQWLQEAREYDDQDESDWELFTVDDNLKRQILMEFAESVEKAQSQAEIVAIRAIKDDPSWQSNAWYLERSRPHRWGRRTQLSGPYDEDDQPTPIVVDPKAAVLDFLLEQHDQLQADGVIDPSSDQAKGNEHE
jgi:transposase-like protein